MGHTPNSYQISNPFKGIYTKKENVILLAHNLIGTVRGKSANGLMMHSKLFNVVAIVDENAAGKDTSKICKGVNLQVPIYASIEKAVTSHRTKALIFLIPPDLKYIDELKIASIRGIDLINTSFRFIKNIPEIAKIVSDYNTKYYDLRDVTHQQAYPNIDILNRKAKVVFVTGTDCGLGKRTATFELTQAAKKIGIKATMYATGQTGLMLGEQGTVIDSLIIEFSNGVISQQICQFDRLGYELIFVEGQSDIYHPANSAMSLALLHGSNPDCVIMVHDETRKQHKGFEEESPLYKMHPLHKHIQAIELMSLPCGPSYKTVGIATIGDENIYNLSQLFEREQIPVSDVRKKDGPTILLKAILNYLFMEHGWSPGKQIIDKEIIDF